MSERRVGKFELFRLITPILITLCLTLLSAIWSDLNKVKEDITTLKVDMSAVKTDLKYRR